MSVFCVFLLSRCYGENAGQRSYFQVCGYCNSILHSVAAVHLRLFQSVLDADIQLIVRKHKFDHITPTLRDNIHWLPADKRIEFKLCLLAFKLSAPDGTTIRCASSCRPTLVVVSYDQRLVMICPRSVAVSGRRAGIVCRRN